VTKGRRDDKAGAAPREGRGDGRAASELRPVAIETGASRWAEGSALITQGETKVLCTVSVED
jgi:ribonuclease PH